MFTGLPLYLGIGGLVVVVALSGVIWVQHGRLEAKEETITALKLSVGAWQQKFDEKSEALTICVDINRKNKEQIDDLKEWARIAEERQQEIARLLREKAQAKDELQVIADAYRELRTVAVTMNVCQTYELALVHVAEGGAP